MKAARISRPSSVRIGMFCRFGLVEDSRPVAVPGQLHRPRDQRMRPPRREPDHKRLIVDPAEPPERLLRRAGHDLRAKIEQHQQVAEIA
ncbi:MAG: hypothetical protein ACRD4I_14790, partial [Candidatus Angelobacter sp.]